MRAIAALFVLATCGAVFLATAPLSATAIVVIRTNDRIVLSADSAFEKLGPGDGFKRCKISQAGRWGVLVGGISDASTGLDVHKAIRVAIEKSDNLQAVQAAIVGPVSREIKAAIEGPLAPLVTKRFAPGNWIAVLVVAGQDADGVLKAGVLVVVLQSLQPVTVATTWVSCPGRACDAEGRMFLVSAATSEPGNSLIKSPQVPWVARADVATARGIVQAHIDATPELVKAPIDSLEITKGGAVWQQRDPRSLCSPLSH